MCLLFKIIFSVFLFVCTTSAGFAQTNVPILVYHNFDPIKSGSMTVTPNRFEMQLNWMLKKGYTVIPLQTLVNYLLGKISAIPAKSVVITIDDGRKSVDTYLLPIVQKYKIPVTLFIFPQVISHASYALTWDDLKSLQKTGLFDIQDHTYWHPNFKQEKKRLSKTAYIKLVHTQLVTSKKVLEEKLNSKITLLAWPFGIYDADLERDAKNAGYLMAFSIKARPANRQEASMAMPRYMIIADQSMKMFEMIVQGRSFSKKSPAYPKDNE